MLALPQTLLQRSAMWLLLLGVGAQVPLIWQRRPILCVIHEVVVFMRSITSLQLFQRCQIAALKRGNVVALPAVSSMTLIVLACGW